MPHVDITMIPGRNHEQKKEIAVKIQKFLAEELKISENFITVSIEDIPMESWEEHMKGMTDKIRYI